MKLTRLFAPVLATVARVREMFGPAPEAAGMRFDGPGLRAYLGTTTKIAAEIKSVLGPRDPRLIGLRERLMMRDDPDVAFGLAILRAPIVGLKWSIESEDEEISAFVDAVLRPIYYQLALGASLAIHFGNQVLAKEYDVVDRFEVSVTRDSSGKADVRSYPNAIVFRRFKTIDPKTISLLFDPATDDWAGVEQNQGGGNVVRVGKDGALYWGYRRQEVYGKLQGYPQSDVYHDPWYGKHGLLFCRNRYMENRADPPWKGWAQPELDKGVAKIDGFQFMHEQLTSVRGGGSILMPNERDDRGNLKFDAALVKDDKRGDMFQQAIEWQSTQIYRAMWIGDKAATAGDGQGSMAQAAVHAQTMAGAMDGVLNEWIEIVNDQVVTPLSILNFGPERTRSARPRLAGNGISAELKALFKDLILNLIQVEQLQQQGDPVSFVKRIDRVALAQQLGIPLRAEDEVKAMERGKPPSENPEEDDAVPSLTGKHGDPPAPTGTQEVQVTTDAVLNGAQISAAVDIVAKVVTAEIPEDAALGMLEVLFNLTTEQAKKILGSAKAAKKDPGPPPGAPPSPTAGAGGPAPAPARGDEGGPRLPATGSKGPG